MSAKENDPKSTIEEEESPLNIKEPVTFKDNESPISVKEKLTKENYELGNGRLYSGEMIED